jgi:hypothetical protein
MNLAHDQRGAVSSFSSLARGLQVLLPVHPRFFCGTEGVAVPFLTPKPFLSRLRHTSVSKRPNWLVEAACVAWIAQAPECSRRAGWRFHIVRHSTQTFCLTLAEVVNCGRHNVMTRAKFGADTTIVRSDASGNDGGGFTSVSLNDSSSG